VGQDLLTSCCFAAFFFALRNWFFVGFTAAGMMDESTGFLYRRGYEKGRDGSQEITTAEEGYRSMDECS